MALSGIWARWKAEATAAGNSSSAASAVQAQVASAKARRNLGFIEATSTSDQGNRGGAGWYRAEE